MPDWELIDATYPEDAPEQRAQQDALRDDYSDDGWCTPAQEMTPEEWTARQEYFGAVWSEWLKRRRGDYVQNRKIAEMYKKQARLLDIEAFHVFADWLFDRLDAERDALIAEIEAEMAAEQSPDTEEVNDD